MTPPVIARSTGMHAYTSSPPPKAWSATRQRPVVDATRAAASSAAGRMVASTQIQLTGSRRPGGFPFVMKVKKPKMPQKSSSRNPSSARGPGRRISLTSTPPMSSRPIAGCIAWYSGVSSFHSRPVSATEVACTALRP